MEEKATGNSTNAGHGVLGKVLSGVLALFIVGALVALYYSATNPFEEPFTEFYLLNIEGKASGYPQEINAGEEAMVLVGVVNREYKTMSYKLAVKTDEAISVENEEIVLEHGDKWEEVTGFVVNEVGANQTVEFLLYENESGEIYRTLSLYLTVQ
jgi:uncharacterized membrane protein